MSDENNKYDGNSIKVLKGLEAVRKRPGMYIGDTDDGSGLHHMVFEVVDNSIDEALAGYCDRIDVRIHADGSVSVKDDGRGIPVDINDEEGVSAAELVMTMLHAGGKFDQNSYKVSGGLHGVGVSVVNALSDRLELTIKRDGKIWQQIYLDGGNPEAPIAAIGTCDPKETGTMVRFWPSPKIFSNIKFDFSILQNRLRELSFLNSGVCIVFTDERTKKEEKYHYQGGIEAFIHFINEGKTSLTDKIFYCNQFKKDDGITVEVAIQWIDSYTENVFCFTNNIPQKDGGTHKEGFRRGLSMGLKKYIDSQSNGKKFDIQTEDFREGLTAIVSVKVPDPKFSSQTKDKLVSSEVAGSVSSVVYEKLFEFLNENPKESKIIMDKVMDAAKYRIQARKIRETNKKTSVTSLPGKLSDCVSKDPDLCELYIVEGDSAGGSAKSGRNPEFQAILPLRGKILNVEKTSFDRVISSESIGTLITALGCGIGKDDYNPDNFRYHNVVIMTDADVDGAHIRILLLTFFYRQMPEIIERGYVYVAQPPLYRYRKGKEDRYIHDENEKNEYETTLALCDAKLFIDGAPVALPGEELEKLFLKYVNIFSVLRRLERDIPELITKQLIFVPKLDEQSLLSEEKVKIWTDKLQARFHFIEETGISYNVSIEKSLDGYFLPKISILHFGVSRSYVLSYEFIVGMDYKDICSIGNAVNELFDKEDAVLQIKDKSFEHLTDFGQVHDHLIEEGLKGITIQRYKGLGEMNPSQLYETTMNPDEREFLKVTIDDAIEADKVFSQLMGGDVEPRRKFIAENAHLAELDV